MKDTLKKLSPISVLLHWIIGIAIIVMLALGLYISEFLAPSPEKWKLLSLHKSFGILILWVAAVRILWRFYNGFPKPLRVQKRWKKIAAHAVHGFLLLATIAMPMSGIMMTLSAGFPLQLFGLELVAAGDKNPLLGKIARTIHGLGGRVLIGVIIIHILVAIYHQFFDKIDILKRILGYKV